MKFSDIVSATGRRWLSVILALLSILTLSACNPTKLKSEAAQIPQIVG